MKILSIKSTIKIGIVVIINLITQSIVSISFYTSTMSKKTISIRLKPTMIHWLVRRKLFNNFLIHSKHGWSLGGWKDQINYLNITFL